MRRIPRSVSAAIAVGHPDLHARTRIGAEVFTGITMGLTGPVIAGVIAVIGIGHAVRARSGQNLMMVRSGMRHDVCPFAVMRVFAVVQARHDLALLRQIGSFGDIVAETRQVRRIPVQDCEIPGDHVPFRVVPGARANPVAGVDRGLTQPGLSAEIGMPGLVPRAHRSGELLTMRIGPRQSAQIATMTNRAAGDEKRHRMLLRLVLLLGHRKTATENEGGARAYRDRNGLHVDFLQDALESQHWIWPNWQLEDHAIQTGRAIPPRRFNSGTRAKFRAVKAAATTTSGAISPPNRCS